MIWLQAAVLALAAVGDGDPVLLDFTAVWCQPCQQMAPTIDRLAAAGCRVKKIDEPFKRNKDLARRFGVTKIPCFIVLSGNREVGRVVGVTSYGNLLGLYQRADQIHKAAARNNLAAGKTPPPMPMRPGSESTGPARPPVTQPINPVRPPIQLASVGSNPARGGAAMGGAVSNEHLIAASVRIRVADPKGQSCGTGTIVDAREGWALVLTCGHIFRDSQGKGRIEVDLFGPNGPGRAEAELVSYDLDKDIGLLKFKAAGPVAVARVAPPSRRIVVGEPVINVGCNNGDPPTARHSRISSKNKYLGPANLQAGGMPVEGRSGGGLFSADGQVIGVCNCADPKDKEGLYAAGEVIRSELDRARVSFVYQDQGGNPSSGADPRMMASTAPPAMPKEMPLPGEPVRPPSRLLQQTAAHDPLPIREASNQTHMSPAETATLEELMRRQTGGAQIMCVVNPRSGQSSKSRSVVLDRSAAATLSRIAAELGNGKAEVVSIIRSPSDPNAKSEIIVLNQASGSFLRRLGAAVNSGGGMKIAQR